MRDELDDLMQEVRVKSRREEKQARLEAEAQERALKRARFQALRAAFDAERFRWLAQHTYWLCGKPFGTWTLEEWRNRIDLAMRVEHKHTHESPL